MIWDAISFAVDLITCGKLPAKKLPIEETLAEDYAKSEEGRGLAELKRKHSESISISDSETKESPQAPPPTHT